MSRHHSDGFWEVLRLRLSVARAGQRDSLSWWEDEALTPGADLLLRRLFPRSAARTARRLAILAARARHDVILREWPQAHHLFDLGDEVENRLEAMLSEQTAIDIPRDPIRTRDELAAVLHTIAREPPAIALQPTESHRMVQLGDEVASLPVVDRAVALAWAYTEPAAESLIVPFYLPAWEQE